MRASRIIVGTFVAATLPATAWAQATEEEAESIRQGIESWIAQNFDTPEFRLDLAGEIEVTPDGDIYEVVFPPTDIVIDDGVRIVIESLDITLVPTGDEYYDATWEMPERFPILNRDGEEEAAVTLDKQFGTGIFAPAYETFLTFDLSLEDIAVRPTEEDEGELTIATVAMTMDSQEQEDGVFDSEFEMSIGDVAFSDARESNFDMGLIALEGSITALDMPAYTAFTREFNTLVDETDSGDGEATFFTGLADLVERTPKLFDSMELEYSLRDLNVVDRSDVVTIGEAGYGMAIEGLRGDASDFDISVSAAEISVEPAPPEFAYVPQDTVVRLGLEDLPNDQLLVILLDFLRASAQTNPDNAMMMAAGMLQQAVMEGGSTLQIREVHAIADMYRLMMQGEVIPQGDAAFGAVANAFMEIGGMPDLISMLQNEPYGQEAVQGLTVLQGLGQQGTDDEGREVRVYELELQADGKVLLNGTDMGPIVQGLMQ
ncbi:MAG: hypothetical protein GVY11_08315 [Gammaproteobacteria bacterium]|jgi:hypothetical protein|nr:hypothetical protein [Gammaproteobacteria bacterium]